MEKVNPCDTKEQAFLGTALIKSNNLYYFDI